MRISMEELKTVIAKNISELRRSAMMTQLDLAERLNYSDKAVSKWERAESVPDISVLKAIADIFGVSVDYLLREEHGDADAGVPVPAADNRKNVAKYFIIAMCILLVWLIATFVFMVLDLVGPGGSYWLVFLYAVPVSFIVWLVLNSTWFRGRFNYLLVSGLTWSLLTSIHVTLITRGLNIWMLYILGVPAQAIIITWASLRWKLRQGGAKTSPENGKKRNTNEENTDSEIAE